MRWLNSGNLDLTSCARHASPSYWRSFKSIIELHNETSKCQLLCIRPPPSCRSNRLHDLLLANIWSHLLGAAQFLFGLAQFLQLQDLTTDEKIPASDIIAVSLYYLCVVVCFALSTFFHTCSDHSAPIHKFGNQLDHLGIVLVMWGTGISGAHFAFYCHPFLRFLYFAALTATGAGCAVFTLQPKFRQPTYRTARFLLYCFLGASLFAPVVHGIIRFGFTELSDMMDLRSFLGLAVVNFSGAAIYAVRIPERWFPETFDLIGQSHNLMHGLVFMGAVIRLNGLHAVIDRWHQHSLNYGYCADVL